MDDPRAPEGWNPKLQLVREILLSREPEVAEFPPAWRRYHRLAPHSTAWSRTGTIVLHYRFKESASWDELVDPTSVCWGRSDCSRLVDGWSNDEQAAASFFGVV